jgi:dTDP-glucose 4,6-dehydratase
VKLLVAGGAGFIGSNYVRRRVETHPEDSVKVLDKLTYAGRRENLEGLDRVELVEGDICDRELSRGALEGCDAIVNFAAESHVDRSIHSPGEFIETDVFGTFVLLEAARDAGVRHLQISTDEVYGSIDEGSFTETSPLAPSSPYSASCGGCWS